jgi:hypothetical protein
VTPEDYVIGKAEKLVARIRRIDHATETARGKMAVLADERAATIAKLAKLVGPTEAGLMLGIARQAVWRAIHRSRTL